MPPPGEGSWRPPGLGLELGESPCGDDGDKELKELEVDIAVGIFPRNRLDPSSPFLYLLLPFPSIVIVDSQTKDQKRTGYKSR